MYILPKAVGRHYKGFFHEFILVQDIGRIRIRLPGAVGNIRMTTTGRVTNVRTNSDLYQDYDTR